MKRKILFIAFVFPLAFLTQIQPLPADQAEPLTKEDFKIFQKEVRDSIEQISKRLDSGKDALMKAEALYTTATKHIGLTEKVDTWFAGFLAFLFAVIGAIIGILGYNYFNIKKNLSQFEEKTRIKLAEHLSTEFKANKELLLSNIRKEQKSQSILRNSKILVISTKADTENEPYMELKKNFLNVETKLASANFQIPSFSCSNYHAVIIDNQHEKGFNWDFNKDDVKKNLLDFLKNLCKDEIAVVYFGNADYDGHLKSTEEYQSFEGKFAFSNGLDTLYSAIFRLLNRKTFL